MGEEIHTHSLFVSRFVLLFFLGGGEEPSFAVHPHHPYSLVSRPIYRLPEFRLYLFLIGLINFQRGNKISCISQVTAIQAVSLSRICFLLLIVRLFFFLYCGVRGIYDAIVNSK